MTFKFKKAAVAAIIKRTGKEVKAWFSGSITEKLLVAAWKAYTRPLISVTLPPAVERVET